ncbi:MAG TPA: hypothetical protein VK614_06485 [Allosphingosinicella sp.]|nr:hypothetical protein [Allosphingosinicella sp.]
MRLLAIALALAAATPAAAQTFTLAPEEAVTLRMDGKGGLAAATRGRAEWTPFDLAVARNFLRGLYDQGVGPNSVPTTLPGMPAPPAIVPDQVRLRFLTIAGQHAELLLENGFDRALVYRASITVAGQTRPTDVCVVLPSNRSSEHWPDAVERIELSDFELVDWQEGRAPTCE